MPPRKKTTRSAAQSTLAFHGASNKVTKSGAKKAQAKKNIVDEPISKPSKPEAVHVEGTEEAEPTDGDSAHVSEPEQPVMVPQATSTPEEDAARKITNKEIKEYWDKKEKTRKTPRVHQKDLTVHEKILIEFDMSGHYGVSIPHAKSRVPSTDNCLLQPCVGIGRTRRWKRAHKLGLEPPIEVLAVLLKEQKSGDKHERSRVDEILNSNNSELGMDA
jgi:DNA polymerase delta subunit 4